MFKRKLNVYKWEYLDKESSFLYDGYKMEETNLDYKDTAIIIIDPWEETSYKEVDRRVKENVKEYVLPIVRYALLKDIQVLIFTNREPSYPSKIVDELQSMVNDQSVRLLCHNDFNTPEDFGQYCERNNIHNLIYTGYSIHLCVLFRRVGLISMYESVYRNRIQMYLIPEATLACVSRYENENEAMKRAICIMISQQMIARIIKFDDFIEDCEEDFR